MALDFLCSSIGKSKWVIAEQVFHFNIIDQVLKEGSFKRQLCFFENVVFVAGEKLSEHRD